MKRTICYLQRIFMPMLTFVLIVILADLIWHGGAFPTSLTLYAVGVFYLHSILSGIITLNATMARMDSQPEFVGIAAGGCFIAGAIGCGIFTLLDLKKRYEEDRDE